jgi:hypothetical protein
MSLLVALSVNLHSWGPRIIATNRQAPRIYPRMIPLCSRFDSVLFTPKMSAIASCGNYSRFPHAFNGRFWHIADHAERAHICAMNRIQCNCGAVYEVVDPKDRTRDLNLFKCLVCGKEIISTKAYKVGDLRLIVRPKPDRE